MYWYYVRYHGLAPFSHVQNDWREDDGLLPAHWFGSNCPRQSLFSSYPPSVHFSTGQLSETPIGAKTFDSFQPIQNVFQ